VPRVLWFLRMRAAAVLVVCVVGCTAPNPAFGDGTDGGSAGTDATSGSASRGTSDTTRGDETPSTSTASTSTDDPSIATSDDEESHSDTDPIVDLGRDDGSTTESDSRRVWLFTAAVDNGAFGDPASEDGSLAGFPECADAYQNIAVDICVSAPVPLLRTVANPWNHPSLADSHDAPVLSVDGYSIAETLTNFKDGNWIVEALYDASGGGLELTNEVPIATGGDVDGAPNCGNWIDIEDSMSIADPDGEEGWFGVEEVACEVGARILCVCPA
jgi:hypothetical protein